MQTEDPLQALKRAWDETQAQGEIEIEPPGDLGCQDTYDVGHIKGVGRIDRRSLLTAIAKWRSLNGMIANMEPVRNFVC